MKLDLLFKRKEKKRKEIHPPRTSPKEWSWKGKISQPKAVSGCCVSPSATRGVCPLLFNGHITNNEIPYKSRWHLAHHWHWGKIDKLGYFLVGFLNGLGSLTRKTDILCVFYECYEIPHLKMNFTERRRPLSSGRSHFPLFDVLRAPKPVCISSFPELFAKAWSS